MTKKLFRSIVLVAAVVLLVSFGIIMAFLYSHFSNQQISQMKDALQIASVGMETEGSDYLQRLGSEHYRFTWVAADGAVLYDTREDASVMENHADRAEIASALKGREGQSIRESSTLMERTLYCAERQSDGTVLRISVSQMTVGALVLGMVQPLAIALIAALILSGLLAAGTARRIAKPLNELDLDNPLQNDTYEELAPLLKRLNEQQGEITAQLTELHRQREEFAQITGGMVEAFVLMNDKGNIVSVNPAALRLFHADASCVGQPFLTVERSPQISEALRQAQTNGHSRLEKEYAGRVFRFELHRIESGESKVGVALLAFDVSDQVFAERNRREFTANVSHELKTPLQSIIGSAELLENGMVKPEDMPRFYAQIHREAARLVMLIEDIIRLSQVDEGANFSFEEVELLPLATEIGESLQSAAEAGNVKLTVEGGNARVAGVRRLLYEIVYNLCDNAIKYNKEGGSVSVAVGGDGQRAFVTVSDTGIGIPVEDQSRVFERFYRVDKSRSKASGGTGLGLSIVKHAVELHHGQIKLDSAPGNGTRITVYLPTRNAAS